MVTIVVMRTAWILIVVGACSKSAPEPELASPDAAARCQITAIRAKDTAAWRVCLHPLIRDEAERELARAIARKPDFWDTAAKSAAKLDGLKEADFTFSTMPAGREKLGDQRASYKLDHDSFEVVRQGKHWYIVDTGI